MNGSTAGEADGRRSARALCHAAADKQVRPGRSSASVVDQRFHHSGGPFGGVAVLNEDIGLLALVALVVDARGRKQRNALIGLKQLQQRRERGGEC